MYIFVIAYVYVILMMALTEKSVIAGIMTFMMYCVLPLAVIVYLIGAAQRKRRKETAKNLQKLNNSSVDASYNSDKPEGHVSPRNEPEQD